MQVHILFLLPMAFLLSPGTWAGKIIGGQEAEPHSRPYMAFLHIQDGDDTFRCGGFLVAKNFVLTAAHCQGEEIIVRLGAHDVSEEEDSQQVIPVRRQIPHPEYNKKTLKNDIMLLQLSRNATLTEEVGLVRLTTGKRRVGPRTVCKVAGWGMTSLNTKTNTLWEVNLSVVTDDLCQKRYRYYFPSMMLCVGDPLYQKSIYLGDSGGPLVCGGVVEGIASFVTDDSIDPPVGFTRISHFVSWIKANLR